MSDSLVTARFATLRREARPALIPYITAGFPDRAGSLAALHLLAAEGADIVELGVPFSDPLADGPIIQRASRQALAGGMTLRGAMELVREADIAPPVVLFSYLNPVLAYGVERFLEDAVAHGVAGLLLTDLPVGCDPDLERRIAAGGLDLIRLLAPTTSDARLRATAAAASGFLYLIARLGVTGALTDVGPALLDAIQRVRSVTSLPIAVGFGIATGAQAAALAQVADGVVIGSALVDRLASGLEPARVLMREVREALDSAGVAR